MTDPAMLIECLSLREECLYRPYDTVIKSFREIPQGLLNILLGFSRPGLDTPHQLIFEPFFVPKIVIRQIRPFLFGLPFYNVPAPFELQLIHGLLGIS